MCLLLVGNRSVSASATIALRREKPIGTIAMEPNERIAAVAAERFHACGITATGRGRDLSRAAGISKRTLYQRFGSARTASIVAAYESPRRARLSLMFTGPDRGGGRTIPREQLDAALRAARAAGAARPSSAAARSRTPRAELADPDASRPRRRPPAQGAAAALATRSRARRRSSRIPTSSRAGSLLAVRRRAGRSARPALEATQRATPVNWRRPWSRRRSERTDPRSRLAQAVEGAAALTSERRGAHVRGVDFDRRSTVANAAIRSVRGHRLLDPSVRIAAWRWSSRFRTQPADSADLLTTSPEARASAHRAVAHPFRRRGVSLVRRRHPRSDRRPGGPILRNRFPR